MSILIFFSIIAGVLRFMGVEVASYTSDLSDTDRAEMISNFNNPNVRLDVLLLNIMFNVTGLNLQYCCNFGVMGCFSYNPSDQRQALGRNWRIGQKLAVYWTLIRQTGGFSQVQERTVHAKQAQFYSTQANIPWEIRGTLRQIITYELAREQWGTLESKYVWAREADQLAFMHKWNDPWLFRYVFYFWGWELSIGKGLMGSCTLIPIGLKGLPACLSQLE